MESESHDTPKCQNCGAHLTGRYCPECGQRDYDFNRSIREIAEELAESFWNFDTKLFRGVFDLLFRPGLLTTEFLAGRRVSQVPPLRFYLFVSILFFLGSASDSGDLIRLNEPNEAVWIEDLPLDPASMARVKEAQQAIDAAKQEEPGSSEAWINEFFRERMSQRKEIEQMIRENLPKLVFAMLPVFALITRVVFRRARLGYLSHLVLALHLHSFFFLFSMVAKGWALLVGLASASLAGMVGFATAVYVVVYAIMAARRVFGFSRWGTCWRAALTALLYWVSMAVGFVIFLIILFLLA